MRKVVLRFLLLLLVLSLSQWSAAQAQNRNVTFTVNMATFPDTLPSVNTPVRIMGNVPFTWTATDTTNPALTNIGGDYWSRTLSIPVGITLEYKYVPKYDQGTGWEKSLTGADTVLGDHRTYKVVDKDTALTVEYWNNTTTFQPQYWRPWRTSPDTMVVYFRVCMFWQDSTQRSQFREGDTVAVRGGGNGIPWKGSDLSWDKSFFLKREPRPGDGDGFKIPNTAFWSGALRFPRDSVQEGQRIEYKFLMGSDWAGRDEQNNRSFNVPVGKKDTTLHWVYYNNYKGEGRINRDTCIVTFVANLAKAIQTGGFSIGDTLYVKSGYNGTAVQNARQKTMTRLATTVYRVVDTVVTTTGRNFQYDYWAVKNGTQIRDVYYNFEWTGDPTSSAREKRQVVSVPGKTFTLYDTATSVSKPDRQPIFPNSSKLVRAVLVKYELNLRPAYYQVQAGDTLSDIQGTLHVYKSVVDSIKNWGVWINGPAVGGWATAWGSTLASDTTRKMYDDGTHGDRVGNDTIYTRLVACAPDSPTTGTKYQVGQVYKFGIRAGDNEGGSGGFGNNHLQNIDDATSEFTMSEDWGSMNPKFYNRWDYDNHTPITGVNEIPGLPLAFDLSQNYPNPFNPATKIEYVIPIQSFVTLKVYNLLGQEVMTLVNEVQKPARYAATFNAARLASGVYLYRLTTADFVSTKKMLLLK